MKALAFLLLVCASPVLADEPAPEADIASLVAVVEARGCIIHDKNDLTILDASGLTPEKAHAAVARMLSDGRAEIINDELHLRTGSCK